MVIAVAGNSGLYPGEDEEHHEDFGEEPDDTWYHIEGRPIDRWQPSAPEEDRVQRAHQQYIGIFAEPEKREGHRRIFGLVTSHQFAFRFGQIERRARGFGHRADKEHHRNREQERVQGISVDEAKHMALLPCNDAAHVKCARPQNNADQDKTNGDFIGNHLRGGAHRGIEGIFGVGCPTRNHDAVDAQTADSEDVEQTDIDIRKHDAIAKGNNRPGHQRHSEGDDRRDQEQAPVRRAWNDRFLQEHLQTVGEGLQNSEGTDYVWTTTQRKGSPKLAFAINDQRHSEHQRKCN